MFDKLRPVKDIVEALKTPLNLADETTPGDASDTELRDAAQAMAGAIVRLLRDATGTIDESMLGQKKHIQFYQDVCKVLEYFGLDSSRDFSINGVKYTRDEDGYFRSEISYAAQEAYQMLRNNNRSYALADESTKKRVHYMSNYYLSSAPEEVRIAWQETLEETGINPFQTGYVSTLQQLATEQDFATGGNDQIFGDSIESSLEAIDKILERIANPKNSDKEDYVSSMVPPEQEIEFFMTLQKKLTQTETEQPISNDRVIGMTMIPYNDNVSYGVVAKYAEESTVDNPVIEVVSNCGGEKNVYKVNINEVDPNNATMLEMFALLSYADDQGLSTPSLFSSFQELKVLDFLQKHIEEMQANIEAGNVDFEPTFQVRGKAYTQEEWEKLLEYVDEVEEETQEAMEVEQAMKEAAEESGYDEDEQMDYLSQAFIKKVENLVNGVDNPSDIFGSTVESTLQAAQELLYELENPLTPASSRGENAVEYMEKEKAFYRALIERLEMQM